MKRGLTRSNLIQKVFSSESPEVYVRGIPAQSLFLAIKNHGLASSTDILEIASLEQCRLFIDFDCFEGGNFSRENFWEWLALADEEDGLKHLEKLLRYVDLRLIALLIAEHAEIQTFDDGNDTPPGPGFYTPDKGFTWIRTHSLDPTRTFYMNRFLALVFEKDAEVFYQLIAVPQVTTISVLEDETLQDRNRRLASEGVPEPGFAMELTAPLPPYAVRQAVEAHGMRKVVNDIPIVEPLLYDSAMIQPLGSLFAGNHNIDELESELTLLMNAAVVRWDIPFHDIEVVSRLTMKVKGAINIGIEAALQLSGLSADDVYEILGFQKLFQFGLWHLNELHKYASRVPVQNLPPEMLGSETFSILACAREPVPEIPLFLQRNGTIESVDGSLVSGSRAIEHLDEIQMIRRYLEEKLNN